VQGNTQRLFSGSTTGCGDTHDDPVKCRFSKEAIFYLDITAIAGSLDIEIQTYNPLTDNWHKLAVFDNHTHAYRKITQIGADTSKFYDGPTRTDIVDNSEVFVTPMNDVEAVAVTVSTEQTEVPT